MKKFAAAFFIKFFPYSKNSVITILTKPNTQYSILNPIPNTQYPIPNTQYPIPNTQYPILNTQYLIPIETFSAGFSHNQ